MGEINEISQCRRNENTSSNHEFVNAHFAGDVWKHQQRGDEAKLDTARKNILSATLNVIGEQVKSPRIYAVVAVHLPTPSPTAARALGTLEGREEADPHQLRHRRAGPRKPGGPGRRGGEPHEKTLCEQQERDGPNDRLGAARSGVGLHLN